ncbi:MAG: hypothetical protein QM538_02125 [Methylacidiphilales bacterium]|nr:hypothetical protein [Candidatus Methylacidiphilales bacterium]
MTTIELPIRVDQVEISALYQKYSNLNEDLLLDFSKVQFANSSLLAFLVVLELEKKANKISYKSVPPFINSLIQAHRVQDLFSNSFING